MPSLDQGLYAITDEHLLPGDRLIAAVEQAILGGARWVQYRNKNSSAAQRLAQATALQMLCVRHNIPLIINDDVDLAARVGAAGVHIGQHDATITEARARLGSNAIVGVSCYDRLEMALQAEQAGADHIAFGAFFPSPTKPTEVRAPISLLSAARVQLRVPIVAIGGITPENAPALIAAGADRLAVVSAVFAQSNIRAAAEQFAGLFSARECV